MSHQTECSYGYPISLIEVILGEHFQDFNRWMTGKTVSLCDGRTYNHETKQYEPDECRYEPHGCVVWEEDFQNFLEGRPEITGLDLV